MEIKNDTGYVDAQEAARILGVNQRTVRNLVACGQLDPKPAYVDTQEAARVLGVSQRAVRNLVARGQLEPTTDEETMATRLLISVPSLERLTSSKSKR